jgi:hypothetical protein
MAQIVERSGIENNRSTEMNVSYKYISYFIRLLSLPVPSPKQIKPLQLLTLYTVVTFIILQRLNNSSPGENVCGVSRDRTRGYILFLLSSLRGYRTGSVITVTKISR